MMMMGFLTGFLSFSLLLSSATARVAAPASSSGHRSSCDSVQDGYQCFSQISHIWGQYSPFFSLQETSEISQAVPHGCEVTFVQLLSRHGARYPTSSKSKTYKKLIAAIQRNATSFSGKYAFLETYNYTLGADNLTAFGEDQMVNSGKKFYHRYEKLAKNVIPFIRSSGEARVVASAEKFIEGFEAKKEKDHHVKAPQASPVVNVIIPEGAQYNNTLDHSTCTAFEESGLADEIKANFTALVTPSIRKRLEKDLAGVELTDKNIIHLMDMCSFDTVALTADGSELSPFCHLFTRSEWAQYDYLQSLSKYYGYGAGNPLGPAQGIGFTNELIARLTESPVHDHTSTNSTLDSDSTTFPLNATLYADFSHDNGMTSIFFAMGLYNGTEPLSQTSAETVAQMDGYSAAWTVPFAARSYVEKLQCRGTKEPLVRVLVNDRVVPLHGCAVDRLGRCKLDDFIEGLSFARSGGNWAECFA
ncbi:hypothetical protein P175DRAFT_0489257 [Aspergillus ochraceoroseus IBT 24754]|nr:uncharacterized protein P175DRAFT_0489257 [Aspergillus ochraceoroseus IBT 24754]PTU24100.1 hypothetical protein P175DRAFT_0489257 [Aspergillus ochraceoroseus IBT 24754]